VITGVMRFDEKLMPVPECGCWIWTGAVAGNGYGSFKDCGTAVGAHAFAWRTFFKRSIPKGKKLMHRCDTPLCCNPMHLKPGSHTANMRDMIRKGRGRGQFSIAARKPN
jgi:hypothetical protein